MGDMGWQRHYWAWRGLMGNAATIRRKLGFLKTKRKRKGVPGDYGST